MTCVVLASASTARAAMLRQAGVEIEVRPGAVDEAALKTALLAQTASPREVAEALAQAKAVKASTRADGLVIGADSTLELDGCLFDKPATLAEARSQLEALSGHRHFIHSAAVIARAGSPLWRDVSTASLHVRVLSNAFLSQYLEHEGEAITACVGGYRLEGWGAQLFSRIEGDYFTILGLPLLPVLDFLRLHGVLQV